MAFLSTKMMSNTPVIKGIQVVYTSSSSKKPPNAIAEMYGKSSDINSGFGGDYVYLVPIWTNDMVLTLNMIRSSNRFNNFVFFLSSPLDRRKESQKFDLSFRLHRIVRTVIWLQEPVEIIVTLKW